MGKTKTVRFTAVVQRSGPPQAYVLWQDPKKDAAFQTALQQDRIMTVLRERKGKEYGFAGFKRGKAATYLVFPKNLDAFGGKRIVGIKYEQIGAGRPVGKPVKIERQSRSTTARPTYKASPKTRQFEVTLRLTAVARETFLVEADGIPEAKKAALAAAAEKTLDLGKAKITRQVARIKKV